MANNDQVNLRYYGLVNSEQSHEATRQRVHWICKRVVGNTVLDIGCSQGITSILLAREGFQVTGIDIEDTSIKYAKSELMKESLLVQKKARFLLKDITMLQPKEGTYDTVIMGEILEHFSQPSKLLSAAHRLLKKGGRVIITVPFGYLPFHDHKQSFYVGSLCRLLGSYFDELRVEVQSKYICYAGRKKDVISKQIDTTFKVPQLLKWMQLDQSQYLEYEKKSDKLLRERKQYMDSRDKQLQELRQQSEQLGKQLEVLRAQLAQERVNVTQLRGQLNSGPGK
ncbi:Ubiquinone biosynthesis O-methyltransferase [compost metagenome]